MTGDRSSVRMVLSAALHQLSDDPSPHDPAAHDLLSPEDLVRHLPEHHHVTVTEVLQSMSPVGDIGGAGMTTRLETLRAKRDALEQAGEWDHAALPWPCEEIEKLEADEKATAPARTPATEPEGDPLEALSSEMTTALANPEKYSDQQRDELVSRFNAAVEGQAHQAERIDVQALGRELVSASADPDAVSHDQLDELLARYNAAAVQRPEQGTTETLRADLAGGDLATRMRAAESDGAGPGRGRAGGGESSGLTTRHATGRPTFPERACQRSGGSGVQERELADAQLSRRLALREARRLERLHPTDVHRLVQTQTDRLGERLGQLSKRVAAGKAARQLLDLRPKGAIVLGVHRDGERLGHGLPLPVQAGLTKDRPP